jgi:hypothetical protein
VSVLVIITVTSQIAIIALQVAGRGRCWLQ